VLLARVMRKVELHSSLPQGQHSDQVNWAIEQRYGDVVVVKVDYGGSSVPKMLNIVFHRPVTFPSFTEQDFINEGTGTQSKPYFSMPSLLHRNSDNPLFPL